MFSLSWLRSEHHAEEGGRGGGLQPPRGDPAGRGQVLHQNLHHCAHHRDQLQHRRRIRRGDRGRAKVQGRVEGIRYLKNINSQLQGPYRRWRYCNPSPVKRAPMYVFMLARDGRGAVPLGASRGRISFVKFTVRGLWLGYGWSLRVCVCVCVCVWVCVNDLMLCLHVCVLSSTLTFTIFIYFWCIQ